MTTRRIEVKAMMFIHTKDNEWINAKTITRVEAKKFRDNKSIQYRVCITDMYANDFIVSKAFTNMAEADKEAKYIVFCICKPEIFMLDRFEETER